MVTDEMIEKAANAIAEKRGYAWPGTFDAEEIKIGRENMRAALESALSAAEPVKIREENVGFVDFLNADRPYICRKTEGTCYLLIDRETGNVVGYRKYDDDALSAQVQDVAEYELAYKEARQLAVSLHAQYYSDVKQWKPLDDLRGVISQIDNMTCGLVAKHDVAAGWTMVAPSYHRDPYHVEKIMGVRWHLIFKNPNGSSRTISTHDTAEQAMAAAPAKQEGGTNG